MKRYTISLTTLRCITESEESPSESEPYLWVTYFALGPQVPEYATGPLAFYTPTYNGFRGEFPNFISAGRVVTVPSFIASASFDMDTTNFGPELLGCVAVLMEQDSTYESDISNGHIAYAKEMEKQLNELVTRRIQANDTSRLTEAEIGAIKAAVKSKVEEGIASGQGIWDYFRDQDDAIGFTYKFFTQDEAEGSIIATQTFDFPEIATPSGKDRFVLSGAVKVTDSVETVDLCGPQKTALAAKRAEIQALDGQLRSLQEQLRRASPQDKPSLIRRISLVGAAISAAEAQLPALQTAVTDCASRWAHRHEHVVNRGGPVVNR